VNTADGESGDLRPLPPSRPPSRPPRTPSAGKGTPTTTPAHTKCAAYAEPPIDSWHTYAKYTACAEPSRQDGGTPRAAKNGLLVARTPTQRPPTPSSRAPPPMLASHRLRARARQEINSIKCDRIAFAPVPSRAAKSAARREPPRMVSWWHARRLHARARQAAMPRRQRRASHRPLARARQVRCRCRAEPPRQAARRRLHARARQVPRRRGHIRGCNVNQHSRKTMQRAEGAEWKLSTSSTSPKLLSTYCVPHRLLEELAPRPPPLPQAAFYHRSSTSLRRIHDIM
jgi:hypothetical protein